MKKRKSGEHKSDPRGHLSTKNSCSLFIDMELILEDGCLTKDYISQVPLHPGMAPWLVFINGRGTEMMCVNFGAWLFEKLVWVPHCIFPFHQLGAEDSEVLGVDEVMMWKKTKLLTHHMEESHGLNRNSLFWLLCDKIINMYCVKPLTFWSCI